jgi:membrane-associated protein
MEFFHKLFHLLFGGLYGKISKRVWDHVGGLNDPACWNDLIGYIGQTNIYVVLFLIIFCETGLVVTPFLPGDSLLFAIGAIGARQEIQLNVPVLTVLLIIAAVLGDAVNYFIGYKLGPAVFTKETGRLLNKKHLLKAQEFYEKYGGKTIILARFVPVIRTFAPFVAGIGKMNYFRFAMYNVVGGVAWVLICVAAGHFFGQFEFVKKHFEAVIIMIIIISVLPMAWELWQAKRAAKKGGDPLVAGTTIAEPAAKE